MDMMELIRARRSVRNFDGRELTQEDRDKLTACADNLTTPYGQRVTFFILSAKEHGLQSPVISGTDTYIAGKMPRAPHAEEAFGFAFEKLVLFAQSLGIGTTWIAGTMNRPAFEKAIELKDGEVMPCVSPLGYPAARMSIKEIVMRKGIRADARLPFGELFFEDSFETPLTEQKAGKAAQALEMVRWAPSAVNKQPWRVVLCGNVAHFYEKKSKGYTDTTGWDLQKIDLGIALCHFACGFAEKPDSIRLTYSDPGLVTPEGTEYIATYLME